MLVRSWNLFHGNTVPPGRRSYLEEMVRLVTAGAPDVVCLQEVPLWALPCLETWSGMTVVADVARGRRLPPPLDSALTSLDHGLFRSAFTGQANAILLAPSLRAERRDVVVLHRGSWLFGHERRICQIVRVERADGRTFVLGNIHATNERALAAMQVVVASGALERLAYRGEAKILAGDFNTHPELEDWGLEEGGLGIDHILVQGVDASPTEVWPDDRRRHGTALLSDHAPVERRLT